MLDYPFHGKIALWHESMVLAFQTEVLDGRPIDWSGEHGGSVVECRTPEREVRGSRPTAAVLCP